MAVEMAVRLVETKAVDLAVTKAGWSSVRRESQLVEMLAGDWAVYLAVDSDETKAALWAAPMAVRLVVTKVVQMVVPTAAMWDRGRS
jgi:hypothetical protein